jgi:allene oxide cyclase-like protein
MVRKLSVLATVGALLAVGIGGITTALAASDITSPETIVLTETMVKERYLDLGKQGGPPTPGDTFFFVDSLTDEDDAKVGSVRGHCTFQIASWGSCEVGAFLTDRGQIYVEGVVHFTEDVAAFDLPITGGTGDFDNARGSVHIEEVSNRVTETTISVLP